MNDDQLKSALADIDRSVVAVETDLLAVTSGEEAGKYLLGLPTADALLPDSTATNVAIELLGGSN